MRTHTITAGDQVGVVMPDAHGRSCLKPAWLDGFAYYQGTSGQHLGGLVTFPQATTGQRGPVTGWFKVVPFAAILPADLGVDALPITVRFVYDESIPAYAGHGVVAEHTHHHLPETRTARIA